jgi:hypothetical protein
MRKIALLFVVLLLLFIVSCGTDDARLDRPERDPPVHTTADEPVDVDYIFFTHNVQDWPYPEMSVENIHRLIDLHEAYDIPLDIYLFDPIFQYYVEEAPDLVDRLKNSEVVAISYHLRPPYPYYSGTSWFGWEQYDEDEQYDIVLGYEEHKIDLETGESLDEPGGYQFVKDTIGYAPYSVSGYGMMQGTISSIFAEKGAMYFASNANVDKSIFAPLAQRPETAEIRWWKVYSQGDRGMDHVESLIANARTAQTDYVHLKIHDNNWHMENAAFWEVYKGPPPWDLDRAYDVETFDDEYTENMWDFYENALIVVAQDDSLVATNLMRYSE